MPRAVLVKALGNQDHLSDEICWETTEVDGLKWTFVQAVMNPDVHSYLDNRVYLMIEILESFCLQTELD